jgi:hypothetical protein
MTAGDVLADSSESSSGYDALGGTDARGDSDSGPQVDAALIDGSFDAALIDQTNSEAPVDSSVPDTAVEDADASVDTSSPDTSSRADSGNSPGVCVAVASPCSAASLCTDLPVAPIIDQQTPANAASYFSAAASFAVGPCILEPSDGTLIPQNWVRPRFRFTPIASQDLFEIRVHVASQANDLVVFTSQQTWTLPQDIWDALRASSVDQDIVVTVLGVAMSPASPSPAASTATFRIAPAPTSGSIVYWAAAGECNGQSWLEGLHVGEEAVSPVLTPPQAQWYTPRDGWGNIVADGGGVVDCIGCHSAIPDGDGGVVHSVAFLNSWDTHNLGWPGTIASVDPTSVGAVPSWVTPGGEQAFDQPWLGLAAFSAADWQTEHIAISSHGQQITNDYPYVAAYTAEPTQPHSSLAWFDLSSPASEIDAGGNAMAFGAALYADFGRSWGFLTRTGDTNGVEFPAWSHNGKTVAYVSTDAGQDGRLAVGAADIYSVPYNNRQGGTATPLAGASSSQWDEFYPSFSSDDQYVAFTRAPAAENMYYNMHDEIFVVPAADALAPIRLVANDPPACSGIASPGVTNSWPRWSPDVQSCPNGLTYYWMVFSSSRGGAAWGTGTRSDLDELPTTQTRSTSQLYLAGMTVNQSSGEIKTYPALYIWNQPSVTTESVPSCALGSTVDAGVPQSNHTPEWDNFAIP